MNLTQEEKDYILASIKSDLAFLNDVVVSEPDNQLWMRRLSLAHSIKDKLED